jgi:hypothetical protein
VARRLRLLLLHFGWRSQKTTFKDLYGIDLNVQILVRQEFVNSVQPPPNSRFLNTSGQFASVQAGRRALLGSDRQGITC